MAKIRLETKVTEIFLPKENAPILFTVTRQISKTHTNWPFGLIVCKHRRLATGDYFRSFKRKKIAALILKVEKGGTKCMLPAFIGETLTLVFFLARLIRSQDQNFSSALATPLLLKT